MNGPVTRSTYDLNTAGLLAQTNKTKVGWRQGGDFYLQTLSDAPRRSLEEAGAKSVGKRTRAVFSIAGLFRSPSFHRIACCRRGPAPHPYDPDLRLEFSNMSVIHELAHVVGRGGGGASSSTPTPPLKARPGFFFPKLSQT